VSQLFLKTKTTGYYMVQKANQFIYSQLFSNPVWVPTSCTLTSGQTDPLGGTEAFTMTATGANATLLQSVAVTGTLNRVVSLYIKRKTGVGNIYIAVDDGTFVLKAVTGAWVRYDTYLTASGTVQAGIKIATSGDEVYIAWSQLEDGTSCTPAGRMRTRTEPGARTGSRTSVSRSISESSPKSMSLMESTRHFSTFPRSRRRRSGGVT
jgi:hypothetical protein